MFKKLARWWNNRPSRKITKGELDEILKESGILRNLRKPDSRENVFMRLISWTRISNYINFQDEIDGLRKENKELADKITLLEKYLGVEKKTVAEKTHYAKKAKK